MILPSPLACALVRLNCRHLSHMMLMTFFNNFIPVVENAQQDPQFPWSLTGVTNPNSSQLSLDGMQGGWCVRGGGKKVMFECILEENLIEFNNDRVLKEEAGESCSSESLNQVT